MARVVHDYKGIVIPTKTHGSGWVKNSPCNSYKYIFLEMIFFNLNEAFTILPFWHAPHNRFSSKLKVWKIEY